MFATYPTHYHDSFSDEKTFIDYDCKKLRMNVRGISFSGDNFHDFKPVDDNDKSKLESFSFLSGNLCSYTLDCNFAVFVIRDQIATQSVLCAHIEYGGPIKMAGTTVDHSCINDNHHVLHETLQLKIDIEGHVYQTSGESQYNSFDEQLTELVAIIPPEYTLKICWTCNFSDYSPAGSGLFGKLACYRNVKEQYHQVSDKKSLFALWDKRTEEVPETHLCPNYELRQPGSGLYVGEEYSGKRN